MLLKYFPKMNTGKFLSLEIWADTQNTETVLTFLPFVTGRMILYSMKSSSHQTMPASWSVCGYHFPPTYLAQFQKPIHSALEEFLLLVLLTKSHYRTLWNNPKFSDIMRENRCTENEKNSLCTLLDFWEGRIGWVQFIRSIKIKPTIILKDLSLHI